MGVKHLKFRIGYFDYNEKRESQYSLNSIIGVEFLAEFGATTMTNEDTENKILLLRCTGTTDIDCQKDKRREVAVQLFGRESNLIKQSIINLE